MSKICILVKNEFIKSMKKTSTKIMIIITILSLLLAVGISKLMEFEQKYYEGEYLTTVNWKEELTKEIQECKNQLENEVSQNIKAELQATIEAYELAVETDVNVNYSSNWKTSAIEDIKNDKQEMYLLEEGTEEYNTAKAEIDRKIQLIKEDNFDEYVINAEIKNLEEELENKEISEQEYNDKIEIENLKKKYEIGKGETTTTDWKSTVIYELDTIKESIRTGIDTNTGKVLDYNKLDELKETEKIDIYRLEHNIAPVDTASNYRSFYDYMSASMSMLFVGILAIMLAGSSISSEISKGTIKFWVMTPNKRWKILFAKLINIVLIILSLTVVLSLISTVVGNIFFSEEPSPYLYVSNGQVQELSPMLYRVLNYLTYDIDIFVYTVFALMLSTIIRNTALSIGISVAAYVGSGMVMQILNIFIKADWLKFIPFNNMNLTDKIFSNSISYTTTTTASEFANNVSLSFSLSVLAICVILMLVSMFDSFNKRDIL